MKHAKTSAVADTADGTLVQPSDWNEPHVRTLGEVVCIGVARFQLSGTTVLYPTAFCAAGHIGLASRIAIGEYKVPVPIAALEADLLPEATRTFETFGTLNVRPHGALTSGYQWSIGAVGDELQIQLGDASWNLVNPNVLVDVEVTVFAKVV